MLAESNVSLEAYLDIPYVLHAVSVKSVSGDWVSRLSYPELPGCVVEHPRALEGYEKLEELRMEIISRRLAAGQSIPRPRPALRI